MTHKKVTRTAALAAVAATALAACSAGAANSESAPDSTGAGAADGGTITVALTGEPTNLDFTTTAGSAIPQALMSNVYEGLVEIDQDGEIQPLLAESWAVSEDGRTYTFELQSGVTFSNGEAFTAEDVKFSIERVKSDAWVSSLKKQMDVVESVEVLSDTEVAVNLSRPSNAWLFSMGTLVGAMFDPSGVGDLANAAVGTGPFTIEEWARGESITMAAREDYWGEAPKVDTAVLRYFADAVATTNALRSGDVDVVYNMQAPELLETFESDDQFQVIEGTSNGEIILSMNNQAAPFDDVRVRQAVMYAIDRQAVIDTAWNGYGTDVGGAAVPPTEPYYEETDAYSYDPERARELLAEAGYADGLDIVFDVPTRPYATAVSEIVVSQLAEVGINATIASAEFPAVWLDKVFTQHDYQMSVVLAVEAKDFLTIFNNPDYYIGYDNSKIATLAAEADAAVDEEEYVSKMQEVVRTVVDDAPADTLFLFPNIIIAKADVTGIPANSVTEALDLTEMGRA
ncbi:ABC transporter substrate-binding protein [Georgenia sp. AZ-5]|uniref:ABC transporter substrate-binding protein n=1 Tax=Georgenia sp. AZ-5 TaxID=3367526 RepID=UPI003754ED3B